MEKWGYADAAQLSAEVRRSRRKFYCYIGSGHDELAPTNTRVAEAKLLAKHGGIRFYDADEGEDGSLFRIRRDQMSWKNKRFGVWSVCCDKMPSDDPSLDPEGDVHIDDEYQPEDYLINNALSDMILLATDKQLPGVEIEAEDSEDEDGPGELGGEGVPDDELGGGNGAADEDE